MLSWFSDDFFSTKMPSIPHCSLGSSMPLMSLWRPICSYCPWSEMGTLSNFSSNLSCLGLKPRLVDKWVMSAGCEQSLLFTEVAPSECFFSCHFSLLVISFIPLPSDSFLLVSSLDHSQLPSLFPCLNFQRHSWFPLGLHSHEEKTHTPAFLGSFLRCAVTCVVLSGSCFQGPSSQYTWDSWSWCYPGGVHPPYLVPMLSRWCTIPNCIPNAIQVVYSPYSQCYPGCVHCPDTLDLVPHWGLVGRWGHNQVFLAFHDLKPVHDVWGF